MNWEAIGAVGEILAALAVVATLAYLAKQIRHQNDLTKYSAWESIFDGFNQVNAVPANSLEIAKIINAGLTQPKQLSADEGLVWTSYWRLYYNQVQRAFKAFTMGYLTEADWIEIARNFAVDSKSPGGLAFREGHDHFFKEFWAEIDLRYEPGFKGIDFNLQDLRDDT